MELTSEERSQLKRMINIAKAVGCGRVTVERIRKRFVEEGLQEALARHKSRRQYKSRRIYSNPELL